MRQFSWSASNWSRPLNTTHTHRNPSQCCTAKTTQTHIHLYAMFYPSLPSYITVALTLPRLRQSFCTFAISLLIARCDDCPLLSELYAQRSSSSAQNVISISPLTSAKNILVQCSGSLLKTSLLYKDAHQRFFLPPQY